MRVLRGEVFDLTADHGDDDKITVIKKNGFIVSAQEFGLTLFTDAQLDYIAGMMVRIPAVPDVNNMRHFESFTRDAATPDSVELDAMAFKKIFNRINIVLDRKRASHV